mmetsp:Transcript_17106/g.43849  ORF Transcript_17106/g.43849 Transcript_17106/m.43849 type:complete len:491 (+) Transcript_17106:96-1568(+)
MCITHEMYLSVQAHEEQRLWTEETKAQIDRSEIKMRERRGEVVAKRKSQLIREADLEPRKSRGRRDRRSSNIETVLTRKLGTPGALELVITALQKPREKRTPQENDRVAQVARTTRFFFSLDASDCEQFAGRMRYQSAQANQILIQAGDEADKFYIVLRGRLQVESQGNVLAVKHAGDSFGELALLSQEKRTADVIALANCDFATLSRVDYLEVVQAKAKAKRDQKMRTIESASVFSELPPQVLDTIADCMRPQKFSGGDLIVQQGTASEELFLVTRGVCAVMRRLSDGRRDVTLHIDTLHHGQTFGEIGVIRGEARSASVVAVHSGEVLAISRIELTRIFSGCPELRDNLERAAADHPSDADILQAWRYDEAWASYRKTLHTQVTESSEVTWSSQGRPKADVNSLSVFDSRTYQPPQDMRSRQLTSSQMFPWANQYLDEKVLPNLADMFVTDDEPPPPPGPAGAAEPPGREAGREAGSLTSRIKKVNRS